MQEGEVLDVQEIGLLMVVGRGGEEVRNVGFEGNRVQTHLFYYQ